MGAGTERFGAYLTEIETLAMITDRDASPPTAVSPAATRQA